VAFRLSVLGQAFRQQPGVFQRAREAFADRIVQWGYLPDPADYLRALQAADVWVSTAHHEFFGIAALEAVSAGLVPVLPQRLAYPELFPPDEFPGCFYDPAADLPGHLERLAEGPGPDRTALRARARDYGWDRLAPAYDEALTHLQRARP